MREHLADTATRAKDFRAAAHHYEAVVARAPYSAVALSRYATALAKIKDPRALRVAERAVELSPENADALDSLGTVWVERGDAGRGLEHLKQARRLAPNRKDIQLHQAVALLRVGQSAQARAQLQQLWHSRDDFPGKGDIPGLLSGL
jgi:tetratricopeptide (TPR) repeat protein